MSEQQDDDSLVPISPCPAPLTGVAATAVTESDPLRSPASGSPCVYWRLRIFETVAPSMVLVHEVSSAEPLLLACRLDPCAPAVRVRVALDSARLEAQPVLHREGSPGARAVAKHFGLEGELRVEEVVVRPGEALQADGFLLDPMQLAGGPFRAAQGPAELMDATIHLTGGLSLRPALLPWALGTAAALLGTSAAAATVAKVFYKGSVVAPAPSAEIGPAKPKRSRWP